jgi:hypothetical protein
MNGFFKTILAGWGAGWWMLWNSPIILIYTGF